MESSRKDILPGRVKQAVEGNLPTVTINEEILVKVQSLIDAHIYYTGQVSGELYEWMKAGAVVDVHEQDVPELLAKRSKKPCCGQEPSKFFQLAQ